MLQFYPLQIKDIYKSAKSEALYESKKLSPYVSYLFVRLRTHKMK